MKNKTLNKKKIYSTLGIIGILGVLVLGGYFIYVKNIVSKWEDKIYPKVTIYGINVSNLTKEEAKEKIVKELDEKINTKVINIVVEEENFTLNYKDLDANYDINSMVDEALNYGKDLSLLKKYNLVRELGEDKEIKGGIIYNEEKLKGFEDYVKSKVNKESVNASISINQGNINIKKEVIGKKVEEEKFHNLLVENIDDDPNKKINLTIEIKKDVPSITELDLKKITGKISGHNTKYNKSIDGREKNMKIATATINGTLLMPGDTFSYNKLIGETTPEKGYEKANTYVGGEVVPDYGGGICQVSTTLYRAVMRANIKSTERSNHSMLVSYSEPGLDATVANDYIDYKFTNTYDFPIYIESFLSDFNVYVNIYGNKEKLDNKTYELVNEIHEKYDYTVKYEDDNTLEKGKEKVVINGMPGYKVSSYLVTYQNGLEVSREYIATDSYKPLDTIIKRGTKI